MLCLLPAIHYLGERLPNKIRLPASDSHYTSITDHLHVSPTNALDTMSLNSVTNRIHIQISWLFGSVVSVGKICNAIGNSMQF